MHLIETVRCARLFSIEPKHDGMCSIKLRYLRLYTRGSGHFKIIFSIKTIYFHTKTRIILKCNVKFFAL